MTQVGKGGKVRVIERLNVSLPHSLSLFTLFPFTSLSENFNSLNYRLRALLVSVYFFGPKKVVALWDECVALVDL